LTGHEGFRRQTARQSAHEGGEFVSPVAFTAQKIFQALISVRG